MKKIKKKIAIIGTNGLPGRYGGWDQLLEHLTDLANSNTKLYIFCSGPYYKERLKHFKNCRLIYLPFNANGYQSVIYDVVSVVYSILKFDILLVLGTSGTIIFPLVKLFSNKPIILNPDGNEWERGKWSYLIKKYLKFSEMIGAKYSTKIITDNLELKRYYFSVYNKESTLIEYGGDHVSSKHKIEGYSNKELDITEKCYAFKVARIVPENNIDLILQAFSKLDLKLVLIGNWKFSEYGVKLKQKFYNVSNLILLDPIYDQIKLDKLRSNCKFYIHGHTVGGTNPSLVEAMYLGLTCIVYDVSYNRITTSNSAIYFKTEKELIGVIKKYNNLPQEELNVFSEKLLSIAKEKYNWKTIVAKYKKILLESD